MLFQAIIIGLIYWVCKWTPGYSSIMPGAYSPMFISVFLGLVLGDVTQAVIIGAYLEAVYLGLATDLGGVTTVDKALATCIVVPVAILGGLTPEVAVTLAIPFGLLGTFTTNIVKTSLSFVCNRCDGLAEEANADAIARTMLFATAGLWLVFAAIPCMVIVYLGPTVVQGLVSAIPVWLNNGLTVAGGLLPALGFAMIIRTIGRKNFLIFFFLGFFVVKYLGVPTLGCAIFGAIMSIVYIQLMGGTENAE